jgi:predicted Zn-dependent peptidase
VTVRVLPEIGDPPRLAPLEIRRHTFANGLTLACVEQRELPMVALEIAIRAGAALDDPRHAGRAVMVAEMLDEGTTTCDVMQIADEIDYLGAHLSISAGWDSTVLALHVLSNRLPPALDVMADVLLRPSFPQAEFERKRRERLSALLQDRDEARIVANRALARGVFGADHPYGMPATGTYATIQALQLADVRAFYEEHYRPANAFVVAVGDVDFQQLVVALDGYFAQWQGAAPPRQPVPAAPVPSRRVLLVDKPRAAQAEVRVGHTAPERATPDYFPLVVMNTLLGGAFTSRLNLKLREEMAVTYGASSKFGWRTQGGIFWAASAVNTSAAAAAAAVMLEEMNRMRTERIAVDELERAAQYIAYGLPRSFETAEDVAAHLREQMLHGFPADYWARYVDRILEVTPQQVAAVAARHLQPDRAVAVIVADRGAVEADLRARHIGEIMLTEIEA